MFVDAKTRLVDPAHNSPGMICMGEVDIVGDKEGEDKKNQGGDSDVS